MSEGRDDKYEVLWRIFDELREQTAILKKIAEALQQADNTPAGFKINETKL